MPKMRFPMSLLHCFHDRWSRRRWSSFYAAINAKEVIVCRRRVVMLQLCYCG